MILSNEVSDMKRKIFSALLALSLMACISLPAFAEKPNYELNGYEYDSVADLENCIRTHSAVKHPDQPYLSTMKVLYLPAVLEGQTDAISDILAVPRYISVYFNWDGQLLELRYGDDYTYQSAAEWHLEDENYYPATQEVNGNTVYSFYDGSTTYCWKQGEEIFALRTFDEADPAVRENFALCQAAPLELNLSDTPADDVQENSAPEQGEQETASGTVSDAPTPPAEQPFRLDENIPSEGAAGYIPDSPEIKRLLEESGDYTWFFNGYAYSFLDGCRVVQIDLATGERTTLYEDSETIDKMMLDPQIAFFQKGDSLYRLELSSGTAERIFTDSRLYDFFPVSNQRVNLALSNPAWEEAADSDTGIPRVLHYELDVQTGQLKEIEGYLGEEAVEPVSTSQPEPKPEADPEPETTSAPKTTPEPEADPEPEPEQIPEASPEEIPAKADNSPLLIAAVVLLIVAALAAVVFRLAKR